ncbi:histone-lysine N-methyltransferase [Plakobranchus ocellatus]|uniref:Histone-lysine N-methyltransferase n=1 Tax=Plakobranchus ocellatus TaxID=259542 RepID=A0AAV3ZPC7_9GAST|nr:histone-lysine N-methyltransferase [Plakobranchus ocellatus]
MKPPSKGEGRGGNERGGKGREGGEHSLEVVDSGYKREQCEIFGSLPRPLREKRLMLEILLKFTFSLLLNVIPVEIDAFLSARQQRIDTHSKEINVKIIKPIPQFTDEVIFCLESLTQQWLQLYGWEILPHPAHSPDLAPSDFHLIGPLKCHLGGMAFETEDDLISELRNWFDNLDVDFFRVGINSLLLHRSPRRLR